MATLADELLADLEDEEEDIEDELTMTAEVKEHGQNINIINFNW